MAGIKVNRDGDKFTVELESKWVKFDEFIRKTSSDVVKERTLTEPRQYHYRERKPIDPDLDVDKMKFSIVEIRRGKEKGTLKFKPFSYYDIDRYNPTTEEVRVSSQAEKDWNWKRRVLNEDILFSLDDKEEENG